VALAEAEVQKTSQKDKTQLLKGVRLSVNLKKILLLFQNNRKKSFSLISLRMSVLLKITLSMALSQSYEMLHQTF